MADAFNSLYDCIFDTIERGENVILHGPGGCGKTYTTAQLIAGLQKRRPEKTLACTALTGVAAATLRTKVPIETRTLHSWAGVGLAKESAERLFGKAGRNKDARERWKETDILFIDEISMLGKELFEKLDYVARRMRTLRKPFGGLQLVLSGDFLQLPPVNDAWVFNSAQWEELDLVPYIFEEGVGKRYDDAAYFAMLLRAREGALEQQDVARLEERVEALRRLDAEGGEYTIAPTLLFSTNAEANRHNSGKLDQLAGEARTYRAADALPLRGADAIKDQLNQIIPEELTFKVGAQVMLRANLSVADGLTNGSRGVVTALSPVWVEVVFRDGRKRQILPYCWTCERLRRGRRGRPAADTAAEVEASRSQIPLILAWGFTIHKSQSCTIDCAKVQLGPTVFAEGQAYVALSRVVNYASLYLVDFMPEKVFANSEAREYSRYLAEMTPIEYV